MRKKPIIVHYHIFKNAGSSIDTILKNALGHAWTSFEGEHAHDIKSESDLRSFLLENPQTLAVSTHLGRPPLPWAGCIGLAMIRHPILRARSIYDFARNDTSQPTHPVASQNDFRGFIEWILRNEPGSVVARNYQVIHLSDASFREESILNAEATRDDLFQAISLIDTWRSIGVVERFADSMRIMEQHTFPNHGVTMDIRWENRSNNVDVPPGTRLSEIALELGTTLYTKLGEVNSLDMELYQAANTMLDRLLSEANS